PSADAHDRLGSGRDVQVGSLELVSAAQQIVDRKFGGRRHVTFTIGRGSGLLEGISARSSGTRRAALEAGRRRLDDRDQAVVLFEDERNAAEDDAPASVGANAKAKGCRLTRADDPPLGSERDFALWRARRQRDLQR